MTYDEEILKDDMADVNKYEFMVMRHLTEHGSKYKTYIMQDLIREFPDEIEHGEYLIPGKEYSDDIDEAVESMLNDGKLQTVKGGLALSEYGKELYDMFRLHPEVDIDEDLADFIEKIEDQADGMV